MDNTQNAPASLRDLAVLITLSMTSYSPRVLDKKESRKLTEHKGAQLGSAKVIRDRLAGTTASEVLDEINSAQAETRKAFYARTLPWDDSGRRMASNDVAFELFQDLKGYESKIGRLADKFAEAWKNAAAESKAALNGLWQQEDYAASPESMRAKFTVRIEMESMPRAADLRMDAPDAVLTQIRQQTERNITARFEAGCKEAHNRLYQTIAHMHERLSDPKAKIYESLSGNLRELVDILPHLNINKDPELTRIAEKAKRSLLNFDLPPALAGLQTEPSVKLLTDKLRDDDAHRAKVANAAGAILADMRAYMGGAPKK